MKVRSAHSNVFWFKVPSSLKELRRASKAVVFLLSDRSGFRTFNQIQDQGGLTGSSAGIYLIFGNFIE